MRFKDPYLRLMPAGREALAVARDRLLIAGSIFLVGFVVVAARLFDVALPALDDRSNAKYAQSAPSGQPRADIVDRNGNLLAASLVVPGLFADPTEVLDPDETARQIAPILGRDDVAGIRALLSRAGRFIWIDRKPTPAQIQQINALGLPGLHFKDQVRRFYPQGSLMSHVVGFTDTDNVGLAGIEKQFDAQLLDGRPVVLSIDTRIQHIVREEVRRQIRTFNGIGGAGVVADARTGEIIAMVSLPDFDPEQPGKANDNQSFNRVALGVYELGSTMKLFNTAMALEQCGADLHSLYDATKPIYIGRHAIRDYRGQNRWLTLAEVLVHSSNIGSARLALTCGTEIQQAFLGDFGFLDRVDIELPERANPLIPSPWREINTMTIAFGHGIAVSPLHLVNGVSALVNGGIRWPVTVLRRDPYSTTIVGRPMISRSTAGNLRQLMFAVVDRGTGNKAAAPGYAVGGKTGTAEKLGSRGRYASKKLLSSFVAAYPMHDPQYVVYVMVDEPKGTKETHGFATGGWVAAPAVRNIIERSAPLLGVDPVDEQSPEIRKLLDVEIKSTKETPRLASF